MEQQGMVYLVGAGPGDPGLMTVKGRELLASCDAVVYDYLASWHVADWTSGTCEAVYVGKQSGRHSMKQEEINGILVKLAGSGKTVVRLKGGDPFVFGRGGEEVLALGSHGIPYEVVPGVTSAVAVPECAGIPVTHRQMSRSFHVITGHTREDDILTDFGIYATLPGTLVFLMGLGALPSIARTLMEGGKSPDTPSAVIEKGTLPGQRVVRAPLSSLYDEAVKEGVGTPAVIVVGETASYDMRCSGARPLSGIRVGVTGTKQFAGKLARALEARGAKVSWALEMKVASHEAEEPMEEAYRSLDQYTWIAFTSANGVRLFFQGLRAGGRDYRRLGHVKFAVIGEGTGKELSSYGFTADYIPQDYCAEALGEGLCGILGARDRLLLARSKGGSPVLTRKLSQAGIDFRDIVLYEVCASPVAGEAGDSGKGPDYLTFASASGVRAYFDRLEEQVGQPDLSGTKLVCIGEVTARELEKRGHKADVTAARYHVEGLVQAIADHAASRS